MNGYPDGCTQADHDAAYGSRRTRRPKVEDPWREARKQAAGELRQNSAAEEVVFTEDDMEHPGDDVCSDPVED